MDGSAGRPSAFWDDLERGVASKVRHALRDGTARHGPLIAYLRDVEAMARAEGDRRQTVQIIASGRSLLGDRSQIGPSDNPLDRIPRAPMHQPSDAP